MAAVVATTCNPDIKAQYERLTRNGKSKMSALGAATRKLVQICFGVLKHQQPYQPQVASYHLRLIRRDGIYGVNSIYNRLPKNHNFPTNSFKYALNASFNSGWRRPYSTWATRKTSFAPLS